MKKQMYFAETRCDKLSESDVAFLISSIPVGILTLSGEDKQCSMFDVPMTKNPKALYFPNCWGYPIVFGGAGNMCDCLLQEDHDFEVVGLRKKMDGVLNGRGHFGKVRLVAMAIKDGRLEFIFWEPAGFQRVKVLPTIMGSMRFDFALQLEKRASSGVRIVYMSGGYFDKVDSHCYRVEQYQWVRHGSSYQEEITMAKDIFYRELHGIDDKAPHFTGYAMTLTVH